MPLIKFETTATLSDEKRKRLLSSLSKIVADATAKPEQYVMVSLIPASMTMAGVTGDTAFADIRSIGGLNPQVNNQLSDKICALAQEICGIDPARVYLNFTDVKAGNWGWNGETFG